MPGDFTGAGKRNVFLDVLISKYSLESTDKPRTLNSGTPLPIDEAVT
jgi:hypothetical protein